MNENQIAQLNHALAIIRAAIIEQPLTGRTGNCPVILHVYQRLKPTPRDFDLSCEELWDSYCQHVESGDQPYLQKAEFLRRLPFAINHVFNIKKSHNIIRNGRRVRGFKGLIHHGDGIDWMPKLKCTDGQGEPPPPGA